MWGSHPNDEVWLNCRRLFKRAGHFLTVYTATAAPMADSNMCRNAEDRNMCRSCHLQKGNLRDIASKSVAYMQWRCVDCCRLLNRIARMQSRGLLASEWHDLTNDQRVEVMRNAMNMFGDDINKTISTSFNNKTDRRYHETANFINFVPITASRRKRKRTSQSDDRNMKDAAFRIARASQRIAKAAFEVNILSQKLIRIRESVLQDITQECVELEATMMAANAHNIKPEIPSIFLAQVTELANGFIQDIEAVGAFKESVAKKRLSEWLQEAKLRVKTCTSIKDELHSYVEDAQNEQHDEHE